MPVPRSTPRSSSSARGSIATPGLDGVEVHLNSIGDAVCRPAYVAELTAYYRAHVDGAAAARARAAGAQRPAPARFQGPGDGRAQRRGAADHRPAVRRVRRRISRRQGASRRPRASAYRLEPGSSAGSTTTRGPRSSSTSSVARASSRRSAAAAATTGWSSCSAAGRRRGSASGSGSTGSSSPWRDRRGGRRPSRRPVAVVVGADPDDTVGPAARRHATPAAGIAARAELAPAQARQAARGGRARPGPFRGHRRRRAGRRRGRAARPPGRHPEARALADLVPRDRTRPRRRTARAPADSDLARLT